MGSSSDLIADGFQPVPDGFQSVPNMHPSGVEFKSRIWASPSLAVPLSPPSRVGTRALALPSLCPSEAERNISPDGHRAPVRVNYGFRKAKMGVMPTYLQASSLESILPKRYTRTGEDPELNQIQTQN